MYKLKTTSTSARFYSWIWKTDITKFKNMCPYFWKYVLTIMFLPLILVGKLVAYLIPKKKKDKEINKYVRIILQVFKPNKFWDIVSKIFKWMFFGIIGIVLVFIIIMLIIKFYQNPIKGLAFIGAITIFVLIIRLIMYLFEEQNLGSRISYPFKLFGNMIYSLYKNVCPLINWEKEFVTLKSNP